MNSRLSLVISAKCKIELYTLKLTVPATKYYMASIVFLFINELDFTIVQNEPNRYIDTFQSICRSAGPRALVLLEAL
jgi:hypothetical protein